MEPEGVRLVIWDLDETLWRGTLTEGGISEHIIEHYNLIRQLAARGIMSSICSKNDLDPVREILTQQKIWDYFIFPSVSWAPKGPRLNDIVKAVQLRAPTILFIDDNPSNRAEAAAHVPGMQIADETFIKSMLDDPRFRGKNDATLERLKQYKLLEKKQSDQDKSSGSNQEFLRNSNIRVLFDNDIETNIDRAIELINRTNQLNFTKKRLPEEMELARQELRRELSVFNHQASLVRVIDNYGDYGYVGFFLKQTAGRSTRLKHFCFSCRTLGMGVEKWVYDTLQRPRIDIVGEVLTDLAESVHINWIALVDTLDPSTSGHAERSIPEVRLRGGCELDALVHYFKIYSKRVVAETNFVRKHLFVRKNVTSQLPTAGFDDARCLDEVVKLGFERNDFSSELFKFPHYDTAYSVVSFWADRSFYHYEHKNLGFRIACNLVRGQQYDLTKLSDEELNSKFNPDGFHEETRTEVFDYVHQLQRDYFFAGRLGREFVESNTRKLLDALPNQTVTYFIVPSHFGYSARNGKHVIPWAVWYDEMIDRLARDYSAVNFVRIDDFIKSDDERKEGNDHFDRLVYHRLFEYLLSKIRAHQTQCKDESHAMTKASV